jgi:hypothetical protein
LKTIERKLLATYIMALVVAGAGSGIYELLGVDNEELTVSMGADVNRKKNVLGENNINISAYEKSMDISPYMAKVGSSLFEWLQLIIDEQRVLDDLKTSFLDVQMWEPVSGTPHTYKAFREECFVEVESYGGNTEAYQIPFKIHMTGKREEGTFNVSTKTFTLKAAG